MPTLAELNGDFSARSVDQRSADRPAVPGNIIPANRITPTAGDRRTSYRAMIDARAAVQRHADREQRDLPARFPVQVARRHPAVDYRATRRSGVPPLPARHVRPRRAARHVHQRRSADDLDQPQAPGYGYQLGHSWVLRSNLINDAKATRRGTASAIPPSGDAGCATPTASQFPQVFDRGRYDEGIPDVSITATPALTGPSQSLLSPTTDITFTDTLTWMKIGTR
jgi:hypothetical protein